MEVVINRVGPNPVQEEPRVLYDVLARFGGTVEVARFSVLVPNSGDETSNRAQALERAKEMARQVIEQSRA